MAGERGKETYFARRLFELEERDVANFKNKVIRPGFQWGHLGNNFSVLFNKNFFCLPFWEAIAES